MWQNKQQHVGKFTDVINIYENVLGPEPTPVELHINLLKL